jgi:CRP-like cAMP-binding protein
MPQPSQSFIRNQLLTALTPDDYGLLRPHLEPVDLPKGVVLIEPQLPIDYVHFPDAGLGSVVALSPGDLCAEIGLFGRDGLAGVAVLLGADSVPYRVLMQVAGAGHRIAAGALRAAMDISPSLRALLLRYAQAFAVQTAHTALSNAQHTVEERLARWLLMSHDRVDGDDIPLTHEFLALMLAIRRPSVTTALHVLEGGQLVRATRGQVTIRDRGGLEELARDSYGIPEAEYGKLIGRSLR